MLKFVRIAALACWLGWICPTARGQQAVSPEVRPRTLFVQTSVEQAWKSAVVAKKPLLVMFTSENCLFCEKMLNETYRHPAIERMLAGNAETVLAHSRDYKALAKKLGVRGFPSTLFVSPEGEVLDFMEGYVDAKAFADRVFPLLNKRTAQASDANAKLAATTRPAVAEKSR